MSSETMQLVVRRACEFLTSFTDSTYICSELMYTLAYLFSHIHRARSGTNGQDFEYINSRYFQFLADHAQDNALNLFFRK